MLYWHEVNGWTPGEQLDILHVENDFHTRNMELHFVMYINHDFSETL